MAEAFDTGRPGYDAHEFFADEFACSLLMPPEKILGLRAEGRSAEEMAEFFDVTTGTVKAWLRRLDRHPPEG